MTTKDTPTIFIRHESDILIGDITYGVDCACCGDELERGLTPTIELHVEDTVSFICQTCFDELFAGGSNVRENIDIEIKHHEMQARILKGVAAFLDDGNEIEILSDERLTREQRDDA